MKRHAVLILLLSLVVIGLSILFLSSYQKNSTQPIDSVDISENSESQQNEPLEESLPNEEPTQSDSMATEENQATSDLGRQALKFPNLDEIREQIKSSHHTMPPLLTEFGVHIHERTEFALQNKSNANLVMNDFISCAKNLNDTLPSMRAMCLQKAREISQKFHEFEAKVKTLEESVDPATKNIDVLLGDK